MMNVQEWLKHIEKLPLEHKMRTPKRRLLEMANSEDEKDTIDCKSLVGQFL